MSKALLVRRAPEEVIITKSVGFQVGIWILYSSYGLYSAVRDGTISQHPLFVFTDDIQVDFNRGGTDAQSPMK